MSLTSEHQIKDRKHLCLLKFCCFQKRENQKYNAPKNKNKTKKKTIFLNQKQKNNSQHALMNLSKSVERRIFSISLEMDRVHLVYLDGHSCQKNWFKN